MADTLAAGGLTFNPLYKEVKNRLTRGLAAGDWKAGEAIPSEVELAGRFKVSPAANAPTRREMLEEILKDTDDVPVQAARIRSELARLP